MLQNILLRIVLFCQLLKSNAVLRSALIRYSLEFGTLTASFSTKNSACNSVYLQAMTDSDNNHFFLQNFHRLEFPIAIPCVHSDNQNVLLLMMIPCSDWKRRPSNSPGKYKIPVSPPHQKHSDQNWKMVLVNTVSVTRSSLFHRITFSGSNHLGFDVFSAVHHSIELFH